MFRVPQDPDRPTFDDTTKIGFWSWLTSRKAQRQEWRRRRDIAARAAQQAQQARIETKGAEIHDRIGAWGQRKDAERRDRRAG